MTLEALRMAYENPSDDQLIQAADAELFKTSMYFCSDAVNYYIKPTRDLLAKARRAKKTPERGKEVAEAYFYLSPRLAGVVQDIRQEERRKQEEGNISTQIAAKKFEAFVTSSGKERNGNNR